jgi:hypothetical protein
MNNTEEFFEKTKKYYKEGAALIFFKRKRVEGVDPVFSYIALEDIEEFLGFKIHSEDDPIDETVIVEKYAIDLDDRETSLMRMNALANSASFIEWIG